jgi:hypothetical protein
MFHQIWNQPKILDISTWKYNTQKMKAENNNKHINYFGLRVPIPTQKGMDEELNFQNLSKSLQWSWYERNNAYRRIRPAATGAIPAKNRRKLRTRMGGG